MRPVRHLLAGAFSYPMNQGSQVYFPEQAIALRGHGAAVTLLTYGSGRHSKGSARVEARSVAAANRLGQRENRSTEHWRALDGFDRFQSPAWTRPASPRAGPSWAKPLADLGFAMTLRDALASNVRDDAFDAILTHNAEATLTSCLMAGPKRPPVLYCVHTLLEQELSAYLKGPREQGFWNNFDLSQSAGRLTTGLDRVGAGIDRWLARRSDGWIALTQSSERVMRQFSSRPGALVPPPIPDPLASLARLDPDAVARSHGLEPGRFFLYSGNLDGYQELDILVSAAAELARRNSASTPLVLASHLAASSTAWTARSIPGLQFRQVHSSAEMLALLESARASLLLRRTEGGFPIKLVNSLAVGTPAIAFHEREWGLEHDRNALICSPVQPVESMVEAVERLEKDDALAGRLGEGARALYLKRHRPEPAAKRVLALVEEVCRTRDER
ncbi:MAG: glycosyltransferase [Proteobacteria bacterium]|nr:glycosyltransferase [Pseudomonadota bacterium]